MTHCNRSSGCVAALCCSDVGDSLHVARCVNSRLEERHCLVASRVSKQEVFDLERGCVLAVGEIRSSLYLGEVLLCNGS